METQNKHIATSTSQSDGVGKKESQLSTSSDYYQKFCEICQQLKTKDELTEEQKNRMLCTWKEYLGICFLNSLVYPLRNWIKQHEIYYNTENYVNSLKSFGRAYGHIALPEEAFYILSKQKTKVRDGILAMANNFLSLKQAIDNSLKEQFVRLCNESQQGMPDILLICGFLYDEFLTQIPRSNFISVTDGNGKELGDKGLAEVLQMLCTKRKTILNITGELQFFHYYSGKEGEERYSIQKAIALYKMTLKKFFDSLATYSGRDIDEIEKLHIKDRSLFYRITAPIYISTLKEYGQDIDAFVQRWESSYESDSDWVMEAKRAAKKINNPEIEESSMPKRYEGKSQCWLKDGILETERSMASRIEKWCEFLMPKLDKLQDYDKKANKRLKQITMISCSMIYGVLEDIGYANNYFSGRYGSSFKNTMEITSFSEDFRRQDMKFYMKMIHAFKKIMEFIKDDKLFSRHSSIDDKTRVGIHNSANQKDSNAEIRTQLLLINEKDDFYWQFILTNFVNFFVIYKEILQRIKRNLKVVIELPQYDIQENHLKDNFSRINNSFIQGIDQDRDSDKGYIDGMFDDYSNSKYNNDAYPYDDENFRLY